MFLVSNRLDTARRTEQDQHVTGSSVYSKHGHTVAILSQKSISSFLHLYPKGRLYARCCEILFYATGYETSALRLTSLLPKVCDARCYSYFHSYNRLLVGKWQQNYYIILTPRETKHNRRPRLFSIKETGSRPASTLACYLTFQHFETLVLGRIAPVEINNTGT